MTSKFGNIIKFPGEAVSDIEAAAARWLSIMMSNQVTLAELAEFELWRAASRDHDRIYRELEALWVGMPPLSLASGSRIHSDAQSRRSVVYGRWGSRLAKIAASVALTLLVTQYLTVWRYEYHTAAGEIRRITLADGSIVHLKGNAAFDSSIGSTGPRRIILARGEAYFDVVHDTKRPFMVMVGNGVIEDVGTGFSVALNKSSTTVAVEHGAVAVHAGGLTDLLTAGQQVSFNAYAMAPRKAVEPNAISVWRRGLYIADGKPLGEVLAEINEYYPGKIVIISPRLAGRRVNAVVQFGHVDAWLDALNATKGVSVRHWGPLTVVSDSSD